MTKFVFFLCAFLIASAACSQDAGTQTDEKNVTLNKINEIKDKVVEIVNESIKQINEKVQEIQKTTGEYLKKLKDEAIKVLKSVYEKIMDTQKKVKAEIEQVIKEAAHLNVTECAQMAEAFDKTGVDALAEVSRCVTDVMEDADGYTENIQHSSNIVVRNLTAIKENAEECVKNVDGWGSATKAFFCVNVAAAKGTWAATKNVPALLGDLGKLTWKITTLLPELTICSTVKSVKKVNEGSDEIVKKVKECIAAAKEYDQQQSE